MEVLPKRQIIEDNSNIVKEVFDTVTTDEIIEQRSYAFKNGKLI